MNIYESYITLHGLTFFAYHGVMPQEQRVGNTYTVDVRLRVDLSRASVSDDLRDTVSYADVYRLIADEMAIPSQLLEHLCGRIVSHLFDAFAQIDEVEIKLNKLNPPMGADISSAGVEYRCRRFG